MLRRGDIRLVFHLHLISSILMLAIAILSQFVSYRVYGFLPLELLPSYQRSYLLRTLLIIGPVMTIEMFTALQLIVRVGDFQLHRLIRSDVAILISIWVITFIFELPLHITILGGSWNSNIQQSLLVGNFARVILWSIKTVIVIKMLPLFYVSTS